jgi:hypothetical protein
MPDLTLGEARTPLEVLLRAGDENRTRVLSLGILPEAISPTGESEKSPVRMRIWGTSYYALIRAGFRSVLHETAKRGAIALCCTTACRAG